MSDDLKADTTDETRKWGPKSVEPDRALVLQDQDSDVIAYNFDEARGQVGWRYRRVKGRETNHGGVPWVDFGYEFDVSWPLTATEPTTDGVWDVPVGPNAYHLLSELQAEVEQLREDKLKAARNAETFKDNWDHWKQKHDERQARIDAALAVCDRYDPGLFPLALLRDGWSHQWSYSVNGRAPVGPVSEASARFEVDCDERVGLCRRPVGPWEAVT